MIYGNTLLMNLLQKIHNGIIWTANKFHRAGKKLATAVYKPAPSLKDINWANYIRNGGESLRTNYDLTANSMVFDLGGFEGQFSSDIFAMYGCNCFIFEAYKPYAKNIADRFKFNNKIQVFNFGLGSESGVKQMAVHADRSSMFTPDEKTEEIELVQASQFLALHKIPEIDLMKINIEGAEFDLLDHLLDTNLIKLINNIQVQFHDFVPASTKRLGDIRERLRLTHHSTFQFDFIWENWKRN